MVSNQPKKSLSLDLGVLAKPNLVDSSEKVESSSNLPSTPEESNEPDGEQIRQEIKNFPPVEVIMRKREPRNTANRLSVISSESDRRYPYRFKVLIEFFFHSMFKLLFIF